MKTSSRRVREGVLWTYCFQTCWATCCGVDWWCSDGLAFEEKEEDEEEERGGVPRAWGGVDFAGDVEAAAAAEEVEVAFFGAIAQKRKSCLLSLAQRDLGPP
jgi:hypothetical protein